MLKYYWRSVVVSSKVYGFGAIFWNFLIGEAILRIFTAITLTADNMLFARYRDINIKHPIFIIGHPRSGTTLLHKLLVSTDDVAHFKTWHLIFPALTARFLVKPFVDFRIRRGKTEVIPESTGHKIDLDQTEEEEMLFLYNYDTQFTAIGMLGFDDLEYPELHFQDRQPSSKRMKSMRFLNGCLQRHVLYTGSKQIIAQTHFSTMRIKTLMEWYPDAKFIYMVRNPLHVVPSFFSLLHKSIDYRWGLKYIPTPVLERYNKRRYRAMIELYRYFWDLQTNGRIPEERVFIQQYDEFVADLNSAFERIGVFAGIKISDSLRETVAKKAAEQKSYRRKHAVAEVERFGITRDMITRDFAFVFDTYGIDPSG